MKILLLGVGMQGKAALHDLVRSREVERIIAADWELEALQAHVASKGYSSKVGCNYVDAADPDSVDHLMRQGPDVVIDLLPASFSGAVGTAAVRHKVHLVNAFYVVPELKELADEAEAQNVTLLPEFGMDPGIDLILLGEAVRSLEDVEEILTYGAGFPDRQAADNPIKYKVAWTFEGVLKSYLRVGRVIQDGRIVEIEETEMFYPENIHEVEIEGLGRLEAIPNGDALKYAHLLGIKPSNLRNLGRYSLRWPGHCAFWKTMVDLHLLDDEPVLVDGIAVDRKRFLAAAIEPHIQYGADERDVVIVRVEVTGWQGGEKKHVVYQLIDTRDMETGLTAMSRTVGYTTSIGAHMIGTGVITQRGLLSPVNDVPYDVFTQELAKRGIRITSQLVNCE